MKQLPHPRTATALACSSLLLCMGQTHAAQALVTPVYANVGNYDKTECVADTANNLIWEGKTADGTRAGSKTYTNYDSNDGTSTLAKIDAATNSIGYLNTVNATPLCGFTGGWRMPTIDELKTLVKTGSSPTIDTTWFPNTPASDVWSGSPYANFTSLAWLVYFSDGFSDNYFRSSSNGVRLVRDGQSSAPLTAQTITLTAPTTLTAGGATGTVTVDSSGASGNAVTFTSKTTSICTVDSSTGVVTPVAVGTCTIAADQAGNTTYLAATQVTKDITVSAAATASSRYVQVDSYPVTECVKDKDTGLIWEGKTADGTRAGSKTYTNYDSTYGTTAQIDAATNSIGYLNTVNATPLCGFTGGWRMPTFNELKTLVKTGSSPTIDTTWFPNTPASNVWSGSPDAYSASYAWVVSFSLGYSSNYNRDFYYGVRLVRDGQSSAPLTAQTITLTAPTTLTAGGVTGTVSATGGSSGNAVTFTSKTTSICTVDSSTGVVTPVAAGTCTIAADQAGNATYSAATQVTKDITVSAAATASSRYVQVDSYPVTDCVKDKDTGLIWEGKTADGSSRDGSKTYTNYDSTYGTTTEINAATNSIGYLNTVNATPLCGFTGGWRMPTLDELKTLLTTSSPYIDTTWFPNNPASFVWSGSPNANDTSFAWYVYFDFGSSSYGNRSDGNGVRLVRGGQSSAPLTAQTITLTVPTTLTAGGATGTVTVDSSGASGNAVTFTSKTTSICTVNTSTGVVTPVAAGTCTIAADQAGNATHAAAIQVTKDITVAKATQTALTASASNASPTVGSTVTLSATGGSGSGAMTYASNNANCTIAGNTLTAAVVGSCVITATKAADANYAATTAIMSITIGAPPSPPSPPEPLTVPKDGSVSNTANVGQELLKMGEVSILAVSDGTQVKATGRAGIYLIEVTKGSIQIPCTGTVICIGGKTYLEIFAGETSQISSTGQLMKTALSNKLKPKEGIARLKGMSLVNAMNLRLATLANTLAKKFISDSKIQSKSKIAARTDSITLPSVGSESSSTNDDWNALSVDFDSGKLTFAVQLPIEINPTQPDGIQSLANGVMQMTIEGVMLNLAPALVDAARFNTALQEVMPSAQMRTNADGTVVVSHNHALYSLRPNLATVGADSSAFTLDANGNLRFGNQGIPPAAYNFDQFTSILKEIAPTATAQVQADGKLVVTLQGVTYTLTPDYHVSPSTTSASSSLEIRNGKLFVNYPFGFSQGFTVQ